MGLIFLSAMATSIAAICCEAGRDAATALGTSLLTMSVATFFTGACTLLVGAWRAEQRVVGPMLVMSLTGHNAWLLCTAAGVQSH